MSQENFSSNLPFPPTKSKTVGFLGQWWLIFIGDQAADCPSTYESQEMASFNDALSW